MINHKEFDEQRITTEEGRRNYLANAIEETLSCRRLMKTFSPSGAGLREMCAKRIIDASIALGGMRYYINKGIIPLHYLQLVDFVSEEVHNLAIQIDRGQAA